MLDSEGKQDIYDIILELKNKKTIIYITNIIDEILMADKIAVIYYCLSISISHFACMLLVLFACKAHCLIFSIEPHIVYSLYIL